VILPAPWNLYSAPNGKKNIHIKKACLNSLSLDGAVSLGIGNYTILVFTTLHSPNAREAFFMVH
jgi:hypothetical protein